MEFSVAVTTDTSTIEIVEDKCISDRSAIERSDDVQIGNKVSSAFVNVSRETGEIETEIDIEKATEKEVEKETVRGCTLETCWRYCSFPSSSCSYPWVLRYSEGAGYAAFATRAFSTGDLILSERPCCSVLGHHPFTADQVSSIESSVSALSEEERADFFAMANVFPEARTFAEGIFLTNSFDMDDEDDQKVPSCGMFLAIARLNHSCSPNVQQTYIPETREEVLYACRDIKEGEEINDCYIELRQDRSRRRKELSDLFRFDCNCKACSVEDQKDDRRRKRALELESFVVSMAEMDAYNALDIAMELLSLLESEECVIRWSSRFISDCYLSIHLLANEIGKSELAKSSIMKAYRWAILLKGPNSPDARMIQRHISKSKPGKKIKIKK